ncbi:hypothetical protein ACROYT_G006102, partial [Oculina patagonica]
EVTMSAQRGTSKRSRNGEFSQTGKQSTKMNELFPAKVQELSPKIEELRPKALSSEPAMFPAPNPQDRRKVSSSLTRKTERELNESFILSQGIKLTAAAKDLSDEKWRLLYEDIFKPLDFYSILHERRKELCSD